MHTSKVSVSWGGKYGLILSTFFCPSDVTFFFFFPHYFLWNIVLDTSHPPVRAPLSQDSYQPGGQMYFIQGMWNQRTTSFQTAAHATPGGSITHLETSTIYLLLHTWAELFDTSDWLVLLSMQPLPVLLSWTPGQGRLSHHWDLTSRSPGSRERKWKWKLEWNSQILLWKNVNCEMWMWLCCRSFCILKHPYR